MLATAPGLLQQSVRAEVSAPAAATSAQVTADSFAAFIGALLPSSAAQAASTPAATTRPGIETKSARPGAGVAAGPKSPTAKDKLPSQPAVQGTVTQAPTGEATALVQPPPLNGLTIDAPSPPNQPAADPLAVSTAVSSGGGPSRSPVQTSGIAAPPSTLTLATAPPSGDAPEAAYDATVTPPQQHPSIAAPVTPTPTIQASAIAAKAAPGAPHAADTLTSSPSTTATQALPLVGLAPETSPAPIAAATPAAAITGAPALQVAHAVSVLVQQSADSQALTIRLNPEELGSVQIRVQHSPDASVQVAVTAERPETMLLLLRDHDGLRQALAQAGVNVNARDISYQVAQPTATLSQGGVGSGQTAMNQGGTGQQGAQGQAGTQSDNGRSSWFTLPSPDAPPSAVAPLPAEGLDITA